MRPIKFRGKRVSDGEWVYGWYCRDMDSKPYIFKMYSLGKSCSCCDGCDCQFDSIVTGSIHLVIPETVGQSIIVEGKEFCEGDVTKDDTGDIGVMRFGKLPLDKSGDCVCSYPAFYIECLGQLGQAPTYACQAIGEWMEIIGTIHTTHPELME